jgi:hypothetical protein
MCHTHPKKKGGGGINLKLQLWRTICRPEQGRTIIGSEGHAYLNFFRLRCREGLDNMLNLFGLEHEVVHELLLVCCLDGMVPRV